MKLDKQLIKNSFAMFADLDGADADSWSILCDNAGAQIMSNLRGNIDLRLNMERLCLAAAALAYFDYAAVMAAKANTAGEIRVGDISVKGSGDIFEAESTRDYFMAKIADLVVSPTGFAFKSTENEL